MFVTEDTPLSLTPDRELGTEYHPLYPELETTELAVHGAEHEFLTCWTG